jgi:hypothetical protein
MKEKTKTRINFNSKKRGKSTKSRISSLPPSQRLNTYATPFLELNINLL